MTERTKERVRVVRDAVEDWYELATEVLAIFEGLPTSRVGGCLAALTAIMAILHSDDDGERKTLLRWHAETTAALVPILEQAAMVRAARTAKETTQ